MVKEHPILFSAPMVRALLEGRKTVTRRLVKPLPILYDSATGPMWGHEHLAGHFAEHVFGACLAKLLPKYEVGQRLWVKEALRGVIDTKLDATEEMPIAAYAADGAHIWNPDKFRVPWRWKKPTLPSMFMPRCLSRLTLEIVGVRVERLKQISGADCILEGFEPTMRNETPAVERFRELWDELNPQTPWESNPWVWRIEFSVANNSLPAIAK